MAYSDVPAAGSVIIILFHHCVTIRLLVRRLELRETSAQPSQGRQTIRIERPHVTVGEHSN
jgi:hypothetical protein